MSKSKASVICRESVLLHLYSHEVLQLGDGQNSEGKVRVCKRGRDGDVGIAS